MFYKKLIRPLFFMMDAEKSHTLALMALMCLARSNMLKKIVGPHYQLDVDHPDGRFIQRYFDINFPNPIGLAAGFDKNAKAPSAFEVFGFGFVEIGTVTAHRQEGNPRVRLWRLKKQMALINRLGFNNDGADRVAKRLHKTPKINVPLGINIGKSKIVENDNAVEDYLYSFRALANYADYIVVNVSSPNTKDLRALQERAPLTAILKALRDEAQKMRLEKLPIFVKISPDLSLHQIDIVMEVVRETGIQGIIATNTTISREDLPFGGYPDGGMSGPPLQRLTKIALKHIKVQDPKMFVMSVGGIFDAEEARLRFKLGANLLQGYTGFPYKGLGYAIDINRGLRKFMNEDKIYKPTAWFNP